MSATYSNPRIDPTQGDADAIHGHVRWDPSKIAWVGGMLLLGVVGSALTISPSAVALFIGFTAATLCFGHSLGMHRLLIHRSYAAPKWLEYALVHFGVLVGLGGPFGMIRTHDLRDWAQRQNDCHSYFAHGEKWHRDLLWQVFCSIQLKRPPQIQIEPAVANDPVYRLMERTWMLQQVPWAVSFFLLGGWGWVCWGIGSRVCISILGHWVIGFIAHNEGQRDWHVEDAAVQGHNVGYVALLTMGESWHNNHHAFPESAKLGLKRGQWDPGWWVLSALARIGLASNIVLPDQLPSRPELVSLTPTCAR
ncbi:MAG: acyl-CoA desaturase [Pseudomonadota bacterium]